MKIGEISGDTLVYLAVGAAAAFALYYATGKVKRTFAEAVESVKDAATEAFDAVVTAPEKVVESVQDVVKPYYQRPTYEDSPVLTTVFDANELLKNNPLNPWNWPDYWKKLVGAL